jgi:NAD(P)-dependent dehydrogenase (short-subunit alcohol dehydrogenase family)
LGKQGLKQASPALRCRKPIAVAEGLTGDSPSFGIKMKGAAFIAGSKAPVEHFTRAAAKEFGPREMSVNNVAPGPMDTPFFHPAESPESIAYHKSASMNGKLTDINDIAPIVRFLVAEGGWITGQTIFANGGYTTR